MKKITFSILLIISVLNAFSQTCPVISSAWDTRTNTNSSLSPKCLATDDYGNIYIAGNLGGISDFNNGVPSINASNGGSLFIVKYDKTGNTQWAINAGSNTVTNDIRGIKVSPDGTQIFIAGVISAISTFGAITLTPKIRTGSTYSNDIFVAKLVDNGGSRTWAWAVNAGGKGDDQANNMAIDNFGKIYIGGYIASYDTDGKGNEDATFGSLPVIDCIYNKDSYVSRLTDNGTSATFDWVKNSSVSIACNLADNGNEDMMIGLACNKTTGDVFIGGFFYNSGSAVSYQPFSLGSTTFPYGYGYEGYVAKLNTNGIWQWATKMGAPPNTFFGTEYVRAISVDSVGSVYITGDFTNTTGFGINSNDIPNLTTTSLSDAFIAKINSSGTFLWAKQMGGTGVDYGSNVVYHNGQVWGIGTFRNAANFKNPNQLTSVGTSDIYLAHLDKNGNWLGEGATRAGGPSDDGFYPTSIATNKIGFAVDNTNVPIATGRYQTTTTIKADFGSTILQKQDDSFVFRANCNETASPIACNATMTAFNPCEVFNENFKIMAMTRDAAGNTYLAGKVVALFGVIMVGGAGFQVFPENGTAIVIKLNTNNQAIYVKQGGGSNAIINDIALINGHAVVTGDFSGVAEFYQFTNISSGLATSLNAINSAGQNDIFVAEIQTRTSGSFPFITTATAWNWIKYAGGPVNDHASAISTNGTTQVVITGYIGLTALPTNFSPLSIPFTLGTYNMYVAKLSYSFNFLGNLTGVNWTYLTTTHQPHNPK